MKPASSVEAGSSRTASEALPTSGAHACHRATQTQVGIERRAGLSAMVVLRDLAQKDWPGSSKGKAHLLPSGSMQSSAISSKVMDHHATVEAEPNGGEESLKHTYEGHLAHVNEGTGARLVVGG